MEPALVVGLLWAAFAGTHIGLAARRPRAALVTRLGERGFLGVFSLVASLTFAALVHVYALHRFDGAAGPALGTSAPWRVVLFAAVVAGVVLAVASLGAYPGSAYAIGNPGEGGPRGLERITRHAFFVGTALAGGAHALLATHLVGSVFFGGLAILALAGAWHQDRKLLARRGDPFAAYLAVTSVVPFAAILSGRQHVVAHELPWVSLAVAVAAAVLLRRGHDGIFAHGGAWVIAVVVGGAAALMAQDWLVARRRARRAAAVAATAAKPAR
jgi:uncharacterized membrane protein